MAHFVVITQILNSHVADEVWIVPSGERPDKLYKANDQARLSMLKLGVAELFKEDQSVKIKTHHLDKETGHSSIELLDKLELENKDHTFFLVIGSELVKDLPGWYCAERLAKIARFLVVTRPGAEVMTLKDFNLYFLPNPHSLSLFISSTELRAMLKEGKSLAGLIPTSVLKYIQEHKLYVAF